MARNDKKIYVYQSPVCLFIILSVAIILTEGLLMFGFRFFQTISDTTRIILDTFLLFGILFPVIYFFVFRPLKTHIAEKERIKKELEVMFDAIRQPIFVHDKEFKLVRANKAYEKASGMSFLEMIGKPCYEVFPKMEIPPEKCSNVVGGEDEVHLPSIGKIYKINYYPILDSKDKFLYSIHVLEDITERKLSEVALRLSNMRLEKVLNMYQMKDAPFQELINYVVDAIVELTKSKLGFLGFINKDETIMDVSLWTEKAMQECNIENKPLQFFIREGGMWAEPVRQRKPVMINDYSATNRYKRGYPEGHVKLKRFLGVPIMDNGRVVMVAAVANKEMEYHQMDVRQASLFLEGVWGFLKQRESEEKIKTLNLYLTSIRNINEVLLKSKDEDELFEEMCRILIKMEFIRAVWIGVREEGSSEVRPIAQRGFEKGFLSSHKVRLDVPQSSLDPVGWSIKTGEPKNIWDLEGDSQKESWSKELLGKGFFSIMAVPLKPDGEAIGALGIYSDRKHAFRDEEIGYLLEAASDIAVGVKSLRMEKELKRSVENLQRTLNTTIEAISLMGEMRDPYTAGHERRVAQLACAIAREIGMTDDQMEGVRVCAFLHDIGKIVVPAEILSKPSELNEYEYGIVKSHPKVGYDILKRLEFPWPVAQIVLQHHEMLDGSGYPAGLKGEEIVLEARILAVADVVEAMSGHRPYRAALGIDKALEEISRNKDVLYDAKTVDACMRLFMEKGFRFEALG